MQQHRCVFLNIWQSIYKNMYTFIYHLAYMNIYAVSHRIYINKNIQIKRFVSWRVVRTKTLLSSSKKKKRKNDVRQFRLAEVEKLAHVLWRNMVNIVFCFVLSLVFMRAYVVEGAHFLSQWILLMFFCPNYLD